MQLQIDNYLCKKEGKFLMKITDITFRGKKVRIEDRMELSQDDSLKYSRKVLKENSKS